MQHLTPRLSRPLPGNCILSLCRLLDLLEQFLVRSDWLDDAHARKSLPRRTIRDVCSHKARHVVRPCVGHERTFGVRPLKAPSKAGGV